MKRLLPLPAALVAFGCLAGAVRAEEAKAPEYAGAESCKKCHLKQYKSWKETKMAKAFDTLKPGEAKEAKEKWKLDPAKDYTQDEKCLTCHTTGYGKPGGYPAIGAAWSDEQKKLAEARQGVQCETCHGPGSLYGPYKKEHKEYKWAEVAALGQIKSDEAACAACHSKDSPTIAADAKFEFEKEIKEEKERAADKKELHEHVEMKYKHE
jgi:formate-dependent nitrite reductase cytochrome c552 subunit